MYLRESKAKFRQLHKLIDKPLWFQPCTIAEIDELKNFLNLPIPKAYEELLLWIGHGCEVLDSHGGHFSSNDGANLQELGLEIMQENGASETLPTDAIVFWIFDEAYSFAFIRASEGDDPPIHYFSGLQRDANGQYQNHPSVQWNWCSTLDKLCLSWIEACIERRYPAP
ncbi:SMI1/KNR4 family protein [Leptolyngbya sp. GGD]|uniref:SMI1/KNR4 family protein n=1 Tax=Leptolyngbya sp. GGD TaxID=2997907 RepID=UPI00227AF8A0|nr:SMI1/KNR4 family protein [Leptolyngbya sp. GGD]MCY6490243.1 SMI1/KNR4 family protein [Leptolyngbya sp. GGD]